MAITAGLTGNTQTIGTTEELAYSHDLHAPTSSGGLKAIRVENTGAVDLHVRIPQIHGKSGFATLPPGLSDELQEFAVEDGYINEVYLKVGATNTTVNWYGSRI